MRAGLGNLYSGDKWEFLPDFGSDAGNRKSDQAVEDQLLEGATGVFGDDVKAEPTGPTVDVKTLHAKIGELTLENDSLSGALGKAGFLGGKK